MVFSLERCVFAGASYELVGDLGDLLVGDGAGDLLGDGVRDVRVVRRGR